MNISTFLNITDSSGDNAKWSDRVEKGIIVLYLEDFKGMVVRFNGDGMTYSVVNPSGGYGRICGACWSFGELFDELTDAGYTLYQL